MRLARTSRSRRSGRAGLTLIEVAIAVLVLSLMVAGLFSALSSSLTMERMTREHQAATEAALQEMDLQTSNPSWSSVAALEGAPKQFQVFFKTGRTDAAGDPVLAPLPPPSARLDTDDAATPEDESTWCGRVEVEPVPDNPNLLKITVIVRWGISVNPKNPALSNDGQVELVSLKVQS